MAINLLVFKAVLYSETKRAFISPQQIGFVWPREELVYASCRIHDCHRYYPGKEIRMKDLTPPVQGCSCGIYGSNTMEIISAYAHNANAVILLWDCRGKVHVRDKGVRATAMRAVAVVDTCSKGIGISKATSISRKQAAIFAASEYFRLPNGNELSCLDLDTSLNIMNQTWIDRFGITIPCKKEERVE